MTAIDDERADMRGWDATAPGEPQPDGTWAIVELMGHVTIIGRVTETTLAGAPVLRIERIDGRVQRVSPQALYRLTDVTEDEAKAAWLAQASWSGSRGLPNALTQGESSGAVWDDEEDPSNSDIDPDAYPDETDTDEDEL